MTYYKCAVSFLKAEAGSDLTKLVTQRYIIQAENYSDAETGIATEMTKLLSVTFNIVSISKIKISDFININAGMNYWMAKVSYLTTTDSGVDKKVVLNMLVNQSDATKALGAVESYIREKAPLHSRVNSITEMPIEDVFLIHKDIQDIIDGMERQGITMSVSLHKENGLRVNSIVEDEAIEFPVAGPTKKDFKEELEQAKF